MFLPSEDRAKLRECLTNRFSLSELKNLAFDLNISYEAISHENMQDYPRELILHLERKGRIACLIFEILKYLQDDYFKNLLTKLPPCQPSKKIQIIVNRDLTDIELNLLIDQVAAAAKVQRDEVSVISAVWGSLRFLVAVDNEFTLGFSEIIVYSQNGYFNASFQKYDSLSDTYRRTWKYVAANHPPTRSDSTIIPNIHWNEAFMAANRPIDGA